MQAGKIGRAIEGQLPVAAVGLLMAGFLAGVLFQTYFGAGKTLRAVLASASAPTPTPTIERREIPLSALPSGRVMVALVFGQSNSANHGGTPLGARRAVYNFHQGRLYAAHDPLLGASGNRGSVWTRLGDQIVDRGLYDAVVFIAIGEGDTHIARWTEDGDLHGRILGAIDGARASGLNITHLLWHQGESDAELRTTEVQYTAMFENMLRSIRSRGVAAPIFVSVATRCGEAEEGSQIQRAQRGLVDVDSGVYPGPNTDILTGPYREADQCHFSDAGLEHAAELWLQALFGK